MRSILIAFLFVASSHAASRFWVGGGSSTNWNATGNTNWSATSGGSNNASVPTSADDVFFDGNSGVGTAVLNTSSSVLSLDMLGYTGALSHSTSVVLTMAGNGGTFRLGGTYTAVDMNSSLVFSGTSGTVSITTAGNRVGKVSFTGAGGTRTLQDALTQVTDTTFTSSLVLNAGTFNTGSNAVTISSFSASSATAKTLTMGSSAITVTLDELAAWSVGGGTNLTITASTAVLTFTGQGYTFAGNGQSYPTVVLNGCCNRTISGTNTFATLTATGDGSQNPFPDMVTLAANQTITGTLTLTGHNSGNQRMLLQSNTLGTARTITNTGAVVTSTNMDYQDITFASAVDFSAATGGSGNCLGNTGITFTTPATQFWVGDGGDAGTTSHWATSSGGTGGTGRTPLCQDNVTFDASSFTTGGQTMTWTGPRLGVNVSFAGMLNSPTISVPAIIPPEIQPDSAWIVTGNLTLISAMTWVDNGILFRNRGTATLTSAGQQMGAVGNCPGGAMIPPCGFTVQAVGGTLILADALTSPGGVTLTNGTLDASTNNVAVSTISVSGSNSNTRTLKLGSGTWSISGTGTVWSFATTTGLTCCTATGNTISITDTSSSAKTFAGGALTYGTLSIAGGGSGAVTLTGANTFNTLRTFGPKTLILPASTTQTVSTFTCNGILGSVITLQSSISGTAATLSKSSGRVVCDYMSIKDSTATGGALWYAGANSTSVSGNTGWVFTNSPPTASVTGRAVFSGKVVIQ